MFASLLFSFKELVRLVKQSSILDGTIEWLDHYQSQLPSDRIRKYRSLFNSDLVSTNSFRVITLRSDSLRRYLNYFYKHRPDPRGDINYKLNTYNDLLISVCKVVQKTCNISWIYCFNNEIHLIFREEDCFNQYNRKLSTIHSTISYYSSYISSLFLRHIIDEDLNAYMERIGTVDFDTEYIEFYTETDMLEYIYSRQHDCKRNTTNLIANLLNIDTHCSKQRYLINQIHSEVPTFNENVLLGFFINNGLTHFYNLTDTQCTFLFDIAE